MRYSLGKQTFYESRAPGSSAALGRLYDPPQQQLGACVIGHDGDFKSMFSEFNVEPSADALEARAAELGFRTVQEKLHVSVHLKDYGRADGAVGGVVLSLRVDNPSSSRTCTVRKIKSSTAKVGHLLFSFSLFLSL